MAVKRPTRQDVALRAGVAPSTVSLILNDRGAELGIALATRQRVEEAARALGYYPNRHIRAIRSGKTGVIGLYLRHDQWGNENGYWAKMRAALNRAVSEVDYQLLIHCARPDCPTEEAFARQAGGVVDGVVILNSANDPIAHRLLETGMHAIEIGDTASPLPFVAVDAPEGIRLVIRHLRERGYRRPALISSPTLYEACRDQRRETFLSESEAVFGQPGEVIELPFGAPSLAQILAWDPAPDAVVFLSDDHAYRLLEETYRQKIDVPHQLAITGFDCIGTLGSARTITSVRTPILELARTGIAKLIRMMDGESVEAETVLPVELRVGNTT